MDWITVLVTLIGAFIASSGFWAYINSRNNKHDNKTKLLIGLGHDRIIFLGMKYIERADITYKENTKQHMNEQIAIFRNYTQDENFHQKLTDELERRKSQNQEILRNYGIKF